MHLACPLDFQAGDLPGLLARRVLYAASEGKATSAPLKPADVKAAVNRDDSARAESELSAHERSHGLAHIAGSSPAALGRQALGNESIVFAALGGRHVGFNHA